MTQKTAQVTAPGTNGKILCDDQHDGVDRRGFLKCMAWAGTGAFCVMRGGVLQSFALNDPGVAAHPAKGDLSFIQISDSHMGFNKPANADVAATEAIAAAKAPATRVRTH